MAATTTAFEAELIAGGFTLVDRGFMAGAAYRLRQNYAEGAVDPAAHADAKADRRVLEALTRTGELASFDAITGP
jgi:hypothetical protein